MIRSAPRKPSDARMTHGAFVRPGVAVAPVAGKVRCPTCTRAVDAQVIPVRRATVIAGQKCSRCAGSLDAGYVLELVQA